MKTYPRLTLPIKAWAEEDRPREKLLHKGRKALTDTELLAILLGSGSKNESAVGLAQRILQSMGNDLQKLGRGSLAELMSFHGMGEAKAIRIVAALELGRRRQLPGVKNRKQITSSRDAYQLVAPLLGDLNHEEFWILMLNRANRLIRQEQVSSGGITGTIVDARMIFKRAVENLACTIILCHNHPSGNKRPSQSDIELTRKLSSAGENLDIQVVDHLIVTERGYYSFADEGLL